MLLRTLRERLITAASGPSAGFPISRSSLAFLFALAAIAFMTFIVFPAQRISVVADGFTRLVHSREKSDVAVMRRAGLTLEPADRVIHRSNRWGDSELVVARATPVVAEISGELVYWRTQAKTVGGALAEIGVTLDTGDRVLVNGVVTSPGDELVPLPGRMVSDALSLARVPVLPMITAENPLSITVKRAVAFTVKEDGHSLSLRSTQPALALALKENGILLGQGDLVVPDLATPLVSGLNAEVRHASKITISLPEGSSVVYTHEKTVADALDDAGIEVSPIDKVMPGRDELVSNGMDVQVVRVTVGTIVEREEIGYQTLFKGDPDLDWGDSRRLDGVTGIHACEYEVTYEDGQEVSRVLMRDWVEQEPQDAVVYYSAASDYAGDIPDGYQVMSVMHVYATWYNPASAGKPRSSPGYGITSTGVPVTRGIVAVDPTVIPYGTRMFIPGYGFAIAADCGGGVKGNMIDLGFPDGVDVDWSSHWVDIYILG
jgi:uncharacterized protein YabE (DUF348 family)/3D (Asp-Asp-Asp) domain-containing protein